MKTKKTHQFFLKSPSIPWRLGTKSAFALLFGLMLSAGSVLQAQDCDGTEPPSIVCPGSVTVEASANIDTSVEALGSATATDSSGNLIEITSRDRVVQRACPGKYNIRRRWKAKDACGNIARCVQVIKVRDRTPPNISCPGNLTIEAVAGQDLSPEFTGGSATATDSFDDTADITITYRDVIRPKRCDGRYNIRRIWIAQDVCGNRSRCVQIIKVRDKTPPVLTCPADLTIEAVANQDLSSGALNSFATATDAFSSSEAINISYEDEAVLGSCGANKTITRKWTATDSCGNTSSCIQQIVVADTTAPEISCNPDLNLENFADLDLSPAAISAVSVSDANDDPNAIVVVFEDEITEKNCLGNRVIKRTCTATDSCGNSSSCVQTITLFDTTPPVISCPEDLSLEAVAGQDLTPEGLNSFAEAKDAFDPVALITISYTDVTEVGTCKGNFVIQRTWVATDACGNSSKCIQTIKVSDTTPPVISCPEDLSLEAVAGQDLTPEGLNSFAEAKDAFDPVDVILISYTDVTEVGACKGNLVIQRTWVATDACGNSSKCIQTIKVSDTTPPVISCPEDLSLEAVAGQDLTPEGLNSFAEAKDTFDPVDAISITYIDLTLIEACEGNIVIKRTWTATDSCGNSTSCLQTITTADTTAPEVVCPEGIRLDRNDNLDVNDLSVTGAPEVKDAFDPAPTVTFSDRIVNLDCGNYNIIRTFLVTDSCGNSTRCRQRIRLRDLGRPIISCPPSITLENSSDLDLSVEALGTATATDGIDPNPEVNYRDVRVDVGNEGCGNYNIRRIWIAQDACGNRSRCVQIIRVRDTSAPNIICPLGATLEDGSNLDTSPETLGFATATDASDPNPEITYVDTKVEVGNPSCGNYNIRRRWIAVDACGRRARCIQLIRIRDASAPEIQCPLNTNLTYKADIDTSPAFTGQATATDNRDANPDIRFVDRIIDRNRAGECGNYNIRRRWIAVDNCGRRSRCVQVIRVRNRNQVACENSTVANQIVDNKEVLSHKWYQNTTTASPALLQLESSKPSDRTSVDIYTIQGRFVKSLYNGHIDADAKYEFPLEANDLPNDLYIYKIQVDETIRTGKIVLKK